MEGQDDPSEPEEAAIAELEELERDRDELLAVLRDEQNPDRWAMYAARLDDARAEIQRIRTQLGYHTPQSLDVPASRSFVVDTGNHRLADMAAQQRIDPSGPLPLQSYPPPSPPIPPVSPRRTEVASQAQPSRWEVRLTPGRALAMFGWLVAIVLLAWLTIDRVFDGSGTDVVTDDGTAAAEAGPIAEIESVLGGMGLSGVVVEQRGEVIHLIGTVPTEAERIAAIGAAQALAEDLTIDGNQLVVTGGDLEPAAAPEADGNRPAALQAEIDRVVAATPIIFESGQATLTELNQRVLNNVATAMLAYQDIPVTIVGLSDLVGSEDANRELSLVRAESVRAYLVAQGVPEGNLRIDARGEQASSGSEALAGLERTVDFEVDMAAVPAGTGGLRVAVITPSASNDLAFSQSMVDSINLVASERGDLDVTVLDNMFVPEDATAEMRGLAGDGYDLIIAHGAQYGAGVQEVATEFPDVVFAWGTASDTFGLPNVYAYDSASEQGAYVLGAMSALVSESKVLGVVAPIEVGDVKRYVDGFRAGAEAEAQANVLVTYTNSFSDLALAAEAAEAHIGEGADVMTGQAQMVVGAVNVASENDVLWFGSQSNQASLAPNLVVASQVSHWEVILRLVVEDVAAGTVASETFTADLANGGLVIEYNPDYALPAEIRARGDQLTEEIANGTLRVPVEG